MENDTEKTEEYTYYVTYCYCAVDIQLASFSITLESKIKTLKDVDELTVEASELCGLGVEKIGIISWMLLEDEDNNGEVVKRLI